MPPLRLAVKLLLVKKLRKRLIRKQRSCSIRPIFYNRIEHGEYHLISELRNDPYYHHKYFRMNETIFDELNSLVDDKLKLGRKHSRPISKLEKLAITLRFLATGNTQQSLSFSYRISPSAIGHILRETMHAICTALVHHSLPVPTQATWRAIEKDFAENWNFPNCVGAMDGKHIRITAPKYSGSMNFNYKGYFSIVLLAIFDANYKFVLVDIGACGSQSDGGIFSRSEIAEKLNSESLQLPPEKQVGIACLPHVIVADDAFPLRQNIMKPFPGRNLTKERRIFNYRMSRARMVSENGFGILAARWRILHTSITGDEAFVKLIVKTCVILHNFLIDRKESSITPDTPIGRFTIPGNWRDNSGDALQNIHNQGSNNHSMAATDIRNHFMDYFNGSGSVPWQCNNL